MGGASAEADEGHVCEQPHHQAPFGAIAHTSFPSSHSIQQTRGQQACGTDACVPHTPPPLSPWHPTYHHQLGTPGASEDPQALEPELPAACPSPPALSCSLLQGGSQQESQDHEKAAAKTQA